MKLGLFFVVQAHKRSHVLLIRAPLFVLLYAIPATEAAELFRLGFQQRTGFFRRDWSRFLLVYSPQRATYRLRASLCPNVSPPRSFLAHRRWLTSQHQS